MSKAGKRGKSGDVKGGPVGGGKWDQVLSSCAFEEESWNPCLTWIVGRQTEDFKHIDALNVIVQTGLRKLFSVVTKEQLFTDVRELGNPKTKKAKEIPANSEVCEACKPHLDAGEPIPVPLLAKLIKWKLMAIKTADTKRRDAETKALADKKKAKDQKDGGKERAKSPKKGGKKTPEPQQAKDGSKLKKRGEEDSDSKYIDDEPDDGAQHYILVTGFHDPRLFQYLEEIGVQVNSVIGVSSQDYERLKKPPVEVDNAVTAPAEPSEEELKEEELKKELKVFWKDLLPLLQRLPDTSKLHDIARLDYEVKSLMIPVDANDAEQKVQYSTALFEDVAVMIYDLLDAKRLHKAYLDNLKLIHVPVYGQEESSGPETDCELKEGRSVVEQC